MATDLERELERTSQMRGFRYGLHDFNGLVRGVEVLRKQNDNVAANYLKKSLLDRKTKELMIIVANMALKDSVAHLQLHMHAAQKEGATPEEILEAVEFIGRWTDHVSKVRGLEAWRATFRPDVPEIDRVVELR